MELRSQVLRGEILHPGRGFQAVATSVEVRWDPLTGHTARLVTATSGGLWPPADPQALTGMAEETQASCPFCAERIERATPRLPPAIWPQGRVRRGRAVLFPNLLAYAQHASVSVYAPELHTLRLGELTPELMTDNLATQVVWLGAVARHDPAAHWMSVNANHLVPSGGSLFHPHLQGTAKADQQRLSGVDVALEDPDRLPRGRDHIADARAHPVQHPRPEPALLDRLLTGGDPHLLTEDRPPGRQHILGGAVLDMDVPRSGLAGQQPHPVGQLRRSARSSFCWGCRSTMPSSATTASSASPGIRSAICSTSRSTNPRCSRQLSLPTPRAWPVRSKSRW
jgi:hypothetical protein